PVRRDAGEPREAPERKKGMGPGIRRLADFARRPEGHRRLQDQWPAAFLPQRRQRMKALLLLAMLVSSAQAQEPVRVYAAGSLRAAFTEAATDFRAKTGSPVALTFGASGLLKERIEKGEGADGFASANREHPQALEEAGRAGPARTFARNRLCALARPELKVASDTLLERMLDPAVKLGTSTPKADPSGDYAFELFAKAEAVQPGARARLEAKALKLTGGPDSPQPPK